LLSVSRLCVFADGGIGNQGLPVVNPTFVPLIHCIGVRSPSRSLSSGQPSAPMGSFTSSLQFSVLRLRVSVALFASKMYRQCGARGGRGVTRQRHGQHSPAVAGLRKFTALHAGNLCAVKHRQFVAPSTRSLDFHCKHVVATRPRLRENSQSFAAARQRRQM
jgi:hypothetical protein